MPHDSGTVHFLALSLRNGAQHFGPVSCCSQPAEEEDTVGSHSPSFRASKQQKEGTVTGTGRVAGMSEEGSFLLEFVPLPQGQLAKLLRRHGEDPREVLC